MHLHGFEPQEGLIKDLAIFCGRLESVLDDMELKANKKTGSSGKEKDKKKSGNNCSNGKKKRCCNNEKGNKEKPFFAFYMARTACTTPISTTLYSRTR